MRFGCQNEYPTLEELIRDLRSEWTGGAWPPHFTEMREIAPGVIKSPGVLEHHPVTTTLLVPLDDDPLVSERFQEFTEALKSTNMFVDPVSTEFDYIRERLDALERIAKAAVKSVKYHSWDRMMKDFRLLEGEKKITPRDSLRQHFWECEKSVGFLIERAGLEPEWWFCARYIIERDNQEHFSPRSQNNLAKSFDKDFVYKNSRRLLCDVVKRAQTSGGEVLSADNPETREFGFCVEDLYYHVQIVDIRIHSDMVWNTPQKRQHLAAWLTRTRGKEPITCSEHWREEDSKCLERILQRSVP